MYHCRVCFYFLGCEEKLIEIVSKRAPLSHFTHRFLKSGALDEEMAADADVIFAALGREGGIETVQRIGERKKQSAELILLMDKEQMEELPEEQLQMLADIWFLPLSDGELAFRFSRWQRRYKMEKDFWQSQNYLDTTINSVPDLIWYKDKDGAHMKVNKSFCGAVNKTMEQIEGRGHNYIWDISPDEYAKGEYICMESEAEVMGKRETCVFDEKVKIKDEMRLLKTYKSPLFDLDGSVMGTVGVATDVTQERLYEQMLIDNANTDFLTGLYNRKYVYQFVEERADSPLTLYYLDLDNFKSVNDLYGHLEGDRALTLTTEVLRKCMPEDMIARLGGDEFLIVRTGSFTERETEDKRKWIEAQLNQAFAQQEHFRNLSASIGTAYSEKGGAAIDDLLGKADTRMYREKNRKKFPIEKNKR